MAARPKGLGNEDLVPIFLCSFEFRLGAGIIGPSTNRSNLMLINNFELGARVTRTTRLFAASLEAPSHYGWAPA